MTVMGALLRMTMGEALLRMTEREALLRMTMGEALLRMTEREALLRMTGREASFRTPLLCHSERSEESTAHRWGQPIFGQPSVRARTLDSSSCAPQNDRGEALLRITGREGAPQNDSKGGVIPNPPLSFRTPLLCHSERSEESKMPALSLGPFLRRPSVWTRILDSSSCAPQNDREGGARLRMTVREGAPQNDRGAPQNDGPAHLSE